MSIRSMRKRAGWGLLAAVVGGCALAYRQREATRRLDRRFGDLVTSLALAAAPQPCNDHGRPIIAVVIAAYNEGDAIGDVLAALPTELAGHRVERIVVVDGATDDTACRARAAGATTLEHVVNRGQGDALRTGFAYAQRIGANIVMSMDADGQHRPDEMIHLVQPIIDGDADYVQGSRFLGQYDDAGGAREIGIRGFTHLINALTGAGITDCTNGFRAIRIDGLAAMRLEEPRFSAPEIIIEAARRGLRMVEVPVHIRTRTHGESKKPRRLGYPVGYLATVLQTAMR